MDTDPTGKAAAKVDAEREVVEPVPAGEERTDVAASPAGAERVAADAALARLSMAELTGELRAASRELAAAQARQLRSVAELSRRCESAAMRVLRSGPAVPGQPAETEVVATAATAELSAALGISARAAEGLADLARRLVKVHPGSLAALRAGRLDLTRVRALVDATDVLDVARARAVERAVLAGCGDAPWAGPSPRAWRECLARAVVATDPTSARRRRERALATREVRSWPEGDGLAALLVRADAEDVAVADAVIGDLARAYPVQDSLGQRLSMDQRRVDALMEVFRRIRDGQRLPTVAVHRQRELGLVVHADTVFGDGPAASAPGQRRGTGTQSFLDPVSAREQAALALDRVGQRRSGRDGEDAAPGVQVMVAEGDGTLVRVVRLTRPPDGGWTRAGLVAAVRAAWPGLPRLSTDRYRVTTAIGDDVRAQHPRCVHYDCARVSRSCDLDHDRPWPRGPTMASEMAPRCRRHHELKTRGVVGTELRPDGSCEHHMLTGVVQVTRPEPLPGFGPGEGYGSGEGYGPGEGAAPGATA